MVQLIALISPTYFYRSFPTRYFR